MKAKASVVADGSPRSWGQRDHARQVSVCRTSRCDGGMEADKIT